MHSEGERGSHKADRRRVAGADGGAEVAEARGDEGEDASFLAGVEGSGPEPAAFGHREHVRLAWLYVRRYGASEAEERLAQTIARFAARHGAATKFHRTMTVAWARLVAAGVAGGRNGGKASGRTREVNDDFTAFLERNPHLGDRDALLAYYTPECLAADEARAGWCEPDLQPLPFPLRTPAAPGEDQA